MTIDAITATPGTRPVERAPSPPPQPAISSDFETFLRMLTAQMENQDPLNPLDSADFAVQLATFSGVEQQVRTNDLLTRLVGSGSDADLGRLAAWVGGEVRVTGAVAWDGAPITLFPASPPDAQAATLIVRNASGQVVSQAPLSVPPVPVEWAGVSADGMPLPPGTYAFSVEGMADGRVTGTAPVAHYARVEEVQLERGEAFLVLEGGRTLRPEEATALRMPRAVP